MLFTPGQLVEEFELPKALLLATGALPLFAWWLAFELPRIRSLPKRLASSIRRDPLGGAVGLMLLSAAISTLTSVRPMLSLFGAPQSHAGLRTVLSLGAIYFASRALASWPGWFRRMAQAAGIAAAVAAGYSILQVAHLDPVTWHRQTTFEGLIRAGSTLGHPNTLSAYLATCLPLIGWLAIRSRSRAAAIGWSALALASLFIVIASLSRGAWLGLASGAAVGAGLTLVAGARPSRRFLLASAALLAIAVAVAMLTPMRSAVLTRVGQIADTRAETSRTRIELWRSSLRMFADHPVLGVGLDAFLAAFPPYRTAELTRIEWGGTPAKAHNDAIQILATQGILGGLAALAILVLAAAGLGGIARRGPPEAASAAIAAGAGLAAYVGSSLVGFGSVSSSLLAAALAGWIGGAAAQDEGRHGAPARPGWALLAGLTIAGILGYFLCVRQLQGEIHLAAALHHPSGDRMRDEYLERATQSAPWDPRYQAEVGRSYFYEALKEQDPSRRLDLLSLSRGALEHALRIEPENGEDRIIYATTLSAQSVLKPGLTTPEQVLAEFRRAVADDPLSPMVLVGAERGLIAAGLTSEARELALRCARAYPDYAPPLADLGAIALEQGRHAAAAETLSLALQRKWREAEGAAAQTWLDLAKARLALGQNEAAAAAADRALSLNPSMGQAFAIKQAAIRPRVPKP